MHFLRGLDALLVKLDELQMESLLDAVKALEAEGLRGKSERVRERGEFGEHNTCVCAAVRR